MRILYFSSFFKFKDSQTYYTEEVNSLINSYPEVEYLVYNLYPSRNLRGILENNKVTRYHKKVLWIQRINIHWAKIGLIFLKDIVKIFTKFKPDVIHSIYTTPSTIMGILGKFFKIPTILHGRGTDMNYLPYFKLKRNIILRLALKINNIVLTVSKSMRSYCLKFKIPEKKIIKLYDGVNFSKFNPDGKEFYKEFNKFNILHIGRFSEEKCHKMIIKVCKLLKDDGFDFQLTLIGIGPLKNQIKNMVKAYHLNKLVKFAGWVDHDKIPEFMKNADLFILPSSIEGLPISVLEAMSMSLPLVLTNVGGMPELAQKFGCILIQRNNIEQLYKAITYYIKNPKNIELGGKINRNLILKRFNWENHSKKLFKIYSRLKKGDKIKA